MMINHDDDDVDDDYDDVLPQMRLLHVLNNARK